jgi:hypothetical protein
MTWTGNSKKFYNGGCGTAFIITIKKDRGRKETENE